MTNQPSPSAEEIRGQIKKRCNELVTLASSSAQLWFDDLEIKDLLDKYAEAVAREVLEKVAHRWGETVDEAAYNTLIELGYQYE